jgi:hypothetical protein
VVVDKGLLDRVEFFTHTEPFNGCDLFALYGDSKRKAGADWRAVNQYRTGAAYPFATTLFRSGEVEIVTEYFEEGPVGISHEFAGFVIYIQGDGCFLHLIHVTFPP